MRRGGLAAAIALVLIPLVAAGQGGTQTAGSGPNAPAFEPLLVAYSTDAATAEGDPDYRQVVYIAIPGDGPPRDLWVFDPDTAGAHDSAFAPGEESLTRMSVWGGPEAFRGPLRAEAEAALLEAGLAVADRVFGGAPELDGRWHHLARLDPAAGALFGTDRVFRFQAEGLAGVEGNVFDLRLGDAAGPDLGAKPEGARLFAYDLTLRAATPETLIAADLPVAPDAAALEIGNFDSGGGVLEVEARFTTRRLQTSSNDAWAVERIALASGEAGTPAAISFFGGRETPNDLSLTARVEMASGASRPIALGLPRALPSRNARPKAEALATPVGCRAVRLDGRLSEDPEGGRLAYRWILPDGGVRRTPVALVRLPGPGAFPIRLEVDDGSGRANARAALSFEVALRDPPRAVIDIAPGVVAPGETVQLSGLRSEPGEGAPAASVISRHVWTVGGETRDGAEIDATFAEPGLHPIRLQAIASDAHPCREGTAQADLRVNAPPVADAGPDRVAIAGRPVIFDAGPSRDPDGVIRWYRWGFGDGRTATGPLAIATFHSPGQRRVSLTVVDDSAVANSVSRDEVLVEVRRPPNRPPTPRIDAPESAKVGDPVVIGSGKSADPDGRLLDYGWRVGDAPRRVGPSAWHTAFEPGTAQVSLALRDASGQPTGRAVARTEIKVIAKRNLAPVAEPGPDRSATVGERIVFDATASHDPDGRVLGYRWVFGPGAEAREAVAVHAFQAPGRYRVTLEVEDDDPVSPARGEAALVVLVRRRPE